MLHDDLSLRGERVEEGATDVISHARGLLRKADLVGPGLLTIDVAAQAELAAEHDLLRNVRALFTAIVFAAANVFSAIAGVRGAFEAPRVDGFVGSDLLTQHVCRQAEELSAVV